MRANSKVVGAVAVLLAAALAFPVVAQEKKAEEKKAEGKAEPAKAKAEKVAGDIGLLDTEKNYMIVVTKEGKRLGLVKDVTFETRTGELLQLLLKEATSYTRNLNLELTSTKEVVVPYNSIIAIGDFVVVSEEDLV